MDEKLRSVWSDEQYAKWVSNPQMYPRPEGEMLRWLRYLDAEIFPNDTPMDINGVWSMYWQDGEPVGFCGWRFIGPFGIQFNTSFGSTRCGFHHRAGVLHSHRGQGLQKRMIEWRESQMMEMQCKLALTYTETYSAASMRSFIAAGYKPFEATSATGLARADRWARMVHWEKELFPLPVES